MMCEICGAEEGQIKYTKVINGEKVEFFICKNCAKEKGFQTPDAASMEGVGGEEKKTQHDAVCAMCGWKLTDVEKRGKFGCANCYEVFRPYIQNLVNKLHGKVKHKGKVPVLDEGKLIIKKRIREVKKELDAAIKKEQYQLAAKLRDRIETLSLKMEESDE